MKSLKCAGLICASLMIVATVPGFSQSVNVAVVAKPDAQQPNKYYNGNRPPLAPSTLIKLPMGAVKPQGWLKTQLQLVADGFFGHLTEISPYCNPNNNAWLNPEGLGDAWWEEVPYWFRGFSGLAYTLGDDKLIGEAKPWIENAIASQTDFGYFGTQGNLFAPVHPPVPAELLTTPDGNPGLLGEYFADTELKELKGTRVDKLVDFDWGQKPPMEGMRGTQWSARWTGFVTVKKTDNYTFSACSDDGVRLWVNDELLVDNWRVQAALTFSAKKPVRLEAGKKYPIKMEYWQGGGGSLARLSWKMPGAAYSPEIGGAPDFMPNMSMLFALRNHYEYTGDKRIIKLMTDYFKWQLSVPDKKFFSGGWQYPRNGDNLDSVYWLYNITGDKFLLDLGAKLMRTGHTWMSGNVTGGHNVDYSQGWRKPGQFYIQSKDPKHLAAAEGNYDSMHAIYGQVPGGMFGGDEFARPGHTDPQQCIETCGTADMMLSQQIMLRSTGDLKWADRCENAAFNSFPAHFTADYKGVRYLTAPNQTSSDKRSKYPVYANGGDMQSMDPYGHRCCQHNASMGWPYFAESLWHATPGNGLAAVMYAPCKVTAKVGDGTNVTINQETWYPFGGTIVMTLSTPKAVKFPLYLRVPEWCNNPKFAINGKPLSVKARPQAFVMLERKWVNGDKVTIEFPMDIKVKTWTKNKDSVSVNRGPLTYSVKIKEQYIRSGGTEKWPAWEILSGSPWNYGLVIDKNNPAKSFEVVFNGWPKSGQPFKWDESPVEIKAKAKKIPNWTENIWGTVDQLQQSPIKSGEPVETISMIPMGAGRLRISALPVIGDGAGAKEWEQVSEPQSSATHPAMPMSAMWDGKVPKASNDRSVPHFSWWPEHNSVEYVIWKFDRAQSVSETEVYWYIDEDGTTTPEWWKLYYKDGEEWKEVTNASAYGLEKDKFNRVTFDSVKTTAIKLETKLAGRSGGISEWRIK